jgi:hypothetical protein
VKSSEARFLPEEHRQQEYGGFDQWVAGEEGVEEGGEGDEGEYERTPKHKIRTPIMEETESSVEQAMRSRVGSRRLRRDRMPGEEGGVEEEDGEEVEELNLSSTSAPDNYEQTPEPQYTETKSSILRRRNSMAKLNHSGRFGDGGSDRQPRRRSRRRYASLTDLTSSDKKKSSSRSRLRRNSISNDDIQHLKRSLRAGEEPSRVTSLAGTKKFSQYTGTGPKEKIEYADYSLLRDTSPPRRFSRVSRPRWSNAQARGEEDLPSLEFTYDSNGDIVSTSSLDRSTSRREKRSEQLTTPRYMDWYTRQQQQQKELLMVSLPPIPPLSILLRPVLLLLIVLAAAAGGAAGAGGAAQAADEGEAPQEGGAGGGAAGGGGGRGRRLGARGQRE